MAVQPGLAAALAGCSGPASTLDPAGPAAGSIATLWWVMLAGAAVLFALVVVLFVLVIRRPGWGSGVSPVRWIVLGGLVLPAVVLPPLVAYALVAGERLLPLMGNAPPRIEAEGRQWVWTFRYPDQGGVVTRNVLHLPAGVPVDIVVTSADVIHSFWVPRLAGKIDAMPGHANLLRIQADEPGRYDGRCSEFCGLGHTRMRFAVVVHRAEDFAAALAQAGKEAAMSGGKSAAQRRRCGCTGELAAIWATGPGLQRLAAVNHSVIGLRFIATAFVFFAIGGVLGMLTRVQLATPDADFMDPETYNQVFTMHGSMLLFLFAIPMIEGIAVYLTPKILGTRDFAFPRLTAYGYWCYLFGGTILTSSLVFGVAPNGGWFMYTPLSSNVYTPGDQRRRLAARGDVRRDFGADAGRRDRRLDPQDARAGHGARPYADLRLVHAGHRADDGGGLSAADPGLDPARDRARLRPAVLRPEARRRSAALAAPVLAVRSPRRLHHLPADGGGPVDDHPGLRQPARSSATGRSSSRSSRSPS